MSPSHSIPFPSPSPSPPLLPPPLLPLFFKAQLESLNQPNFHRALDRKQQKRSHTLRYVLKNRRTGNVLFVVLFTLYLKEDVGEDGTVREGVEGGKPLVLMGEGERRRWVGGKGEGVEGVETEGEGREEGKVKEDGVKGEETSADDVD